MQRTLSSEEIDLLHAFVGPYFWYIKPKNVHLGLCPIPTEDGSFRHGCATDGDEIHLWVGEDTPSLLHEYGHAVHVYKYPESIDWPVWKAEAFAMLSDVRVMKRKGLLTPKQRKMFANHLWRARREGFADHKAGLKLAYRAVFKHFWPKDQEAYVVNAQKAED